MNCNDLDNKMAKIIFFDMDGTIFNNGLTDSHGSSAPSVWTILAKHLGEEVYEKEEATKRKWTNGEYDNYMHWVHDTIQIHREHNLDKDFFYEVINKVPYFNGVPETMKKLKEMGKILIIISGGFKALCDRAQTDFEIDHSFSACEYFWDENGYLKYWNILPSDYEGKVDFMRLMIKEYSVTKEECAFVGDGRNDVYLAKEVGISICFNGAKELEEVSTYTIRQDQEDFSKVLEYIKKD